MCRACSKKKSPGGAVGVVGVALAAALPLLAPASTGTITFTGAVTETTCAPQVNGAGGGNGAVALPVVDVAALGSVSAPQDSAGGTFFQIGVSGCSPAGVAVFFEAGPNVDPATHGLINAGPSNVEVRLYAATGDSEVGSQIKPGTADDGQSVAGEGTWFFYAGYALASGSVARAGTVNTAVTYSLVYL